MVFPPRHALPVLLALGLAALGHGCTGGQDFTYVNETDIKPGPGLFSGPEGAFVLAPPGQQARQPPPPSPAPAD